MHRAERNSPSLATIVAISSSDVYFPCAAVVVVSGSCRLRDALPIAWGVKVASTRAMAKSKKVSADEERKLQRAVVDARRGMNPLAAALASAGVVAKETVDAVREARVADAEAKLAAGTGRPVPSSAVAKGEDAVRALARFDAWAKRAGESEATRGEPITESQLAAIAGELGARLPPSFVRFWTTIGRLELLGGTFTTTSAGALVSEARSLGSTLDRLARKPAFYDPATPVMIVGTRDSGGVGYYCLPLPAETAEAPIYFAYRDDYEFARVADDADAWVASMVDAAIEEAESR